MVIRVLDPDHDEPVFTITRNRQGDFVDMRFNHSLGQDELDLVTEKVLPALGEVAVGAPVPR